MSPLINFRSNIIKFDRGCPNCGAKVEWQSKKLVIDEIYPVDRVLKIFPLSKRMSGEVHTFCKKCAMWSEAKLKKGKLIGLKTEKLQE